MRTATAITLTAIAALCASPTAASASIGTGVGAVPLTLQTAAHAGHNYTFPPLYVKNTGSIRSLYTIRAERITPGPQRQIPAAWVHVLPTHFALAAGTLRRVAVTVSVPAGASPDRYMTDLVASTTTPHAPNATALGAAAADRLSFQIQPATAFPWLWLTIAAAGLACLGVVWARRAHPHLPRSPRRA